VTQRLQELRVRVEQEVLVGDVLGHEPVPLVCLLERLGEPVRDVRRTGREQVEAAPRRRSNPDRMTPVLENVVARPTHAEILVETRTRPGALISLAGGA
jgi:hypothetical protein